VLPTAVKNNRIETVVICTNLAAESVDLGLEVFDQTVARGNSIASGNGAIVDVAPGQTVTFATGETAVLHEDRVLSVEAPVTNLRNGSARVVATSTAVGCIALAVDALHVIEDPAVSNKPPPTITALEITAGASGVPCSPAACDDQNPCTVDECRPDGACRHPRVTDGTACDDGDACTSGDACRAGACHGRPSSCDVDTPCNQSAACDPATGQCMGTAAFSTCIPGGGGKKVPDCPPSG